MNGKQGDDPIIDTIFHGKHPFPSDIEDMILRLESYDPSIKKEISTEYIHWTTDGKKVEEGRKKLKALLTKYNVP
jgi:hypothetical protein